MFGTEIDMAAKQACSQGVNTRTLTGCIKHQAAQGQQPSPVQHLVLLGLCPTGGKRSDALVVETRIKVAPECGHAGLVFWLRLGLRLDNNLDIQG